MVTNNTGFLFLMLLLLLLEGDWRRRTHCVSLTRKYDLGLLARSLASIFCYDDVLRSWSFGPSQRKWFNLTKMSVAAAAGSAV